jgi:hypothetical protein
MRTTTLTVQRKYLLRIPGEGYNLLERIYNYVAVVLNGNGHLQGNILLVRGCRYTNPIESRYRIICIGIIKTQ